MSQEETTSVESSSIGSGLVSVAKSIAQLNIQLARIGYHVGKDGVVRVSGTGKKAGERDRTKVERVVNGFSTGGFIGSLVYTVATGDLTIGAAGILASTGVRTRKRIKEGAKRVFKALSWAFNEMATQPEKDAAERSEAD